jgi:hypothetical protein
MLISSVTPYINKILLVWCVIRKRFSQNVNHSQPLKPV